MKRLMLILPVLLAFSSGQNLLTNGDFEQDLSVGWTRVDSGTGTHEVNRDTSYHPDPDYEAYAYQYDNPGYTLLIQKVDAPGTVLDLSFWAKFEEVGGTSSCWPAACFCVYYYNSSDVVLGETRYYYSTYANWTPSTTLSLYQVSNPDWTEYTLDIAQELSQNLQGVNPGDVAKVGVALWAYTYSG